MSEPLTRLLAELPQAEPDARWAERVRMAGRARLARQARREWALRRPALRRRPMQVWQPLIAVLVIAYLAEVIVQALQVYFR
jgi:hypothetical protein